MFPENTPIIGSEVSLQVTLFVSCNLEMQSVDTAVEFSVGDVVVKPSGKKPFQLTYIPDRPSKWTPYKGTYLHNGAEVQSERVVLYDKSKEMSKKTVYSFTDDSGELVRGLHIGTNSKGLYILEVDDGRDDYVLKDPKDIEEIIPYTFSVEVSGREIHYLGEPGKINEGDFLIQKTGRGTFEIVQVKQTNTRNKQARNKFKGFRVVTEAIS